VSHRDVYYITYTPYNMDSVDRSALWKALQGTGMLPFLQQIMRDLPHWDLTTLQPAWRTQRLSEYTVSVWNSTKWCRFCNFTLSLQ